MNSLFIYFKGTIVNWTCMLFYKSRVTWNNVLSPYNWWIMETWWEKWWYDWFSMPRQRTCTPKIFYKKYVTFWKCYITHGHKNIEYFSQFKSIKKLGLLPIASDFQITVVNLKLRENIQIWSLRGVTGYVRKW